MSALLAGGDASPRPWVDGRKVGEVGEGLSAPGPGSSAGGADSKAGTVSPAHEPVTRLRLDDAAGPPSHPPTEVGLTLPNDAMTPVQPVIPSVLPRLPPPHVPAQPRMVAGRSGHGMTPQRVSLQVLRPDLRIAPKDVLVTCP